jgi:hypothetical protein
VGNVHSDNGSSDLNSPALAVSDSEWGDAYLRALRVVLLDGLSLSRLFLSEYLLSAIHLDEYLV